MQNIGGWATGRCGRYNDCGIGVFIAEIGVTVARTRGGSVAAPGVVNSPVEMGVGVESNKPVVGTGVKIPTATSFAHTRQSVCQILQMLQTKRLGCGIGTHGGWGSNGGCEAERSQAANSTIAAYGE